MDPLNSLPKLDNNDRFLLVCALLLFSFLVGYSVPHGEFGRTLCITIPYLLSSFIATLFIVTSRD